MLQADRSRLSARMKEAWDSVVGDEVVGIEVVEGSCQGPTEVVGPDIDIAWKK